MITDMCICNYVRQAHVACVRERVVFGQVFKINKELKAVKINKVTGAKLGCIISMLREANTFVILNNAF